MDFARWQTILDYAVGGTQWPQKHEEQPNGQLTVTHDNVEEGIADCSSTLSPIHRPDNNGYRFGEQSSVAQLMSGKILSFFALTDTAPGSSDPAQSIHDNLRLTKKQQSYTLGINHAEKGLDISARRVKSSTFVPGQSALATRHRKFRSDREVSPNHADHFSSIGQVVDEEDVYYEMYKDIDSQVSETNDTQLTSHRSRIDNDDLYSNVCVVNTFLSDSGVPVDEDDVYNDMYASKSQFCNISIAGDVPPIEIIAPSINRSAPTNIAVHIPDELKITKDLSEVKIIKKRKQKEVPVLTSRKSKSSSKRRPKYLPEEQHIRWWGHGKLWTTVAVLACLAGSALSIATRRSYAFVHLREPLYISPMYYPLYSVGMLQLHICYNTTLTGVTGCQDLELTAEDVQDNMFDISRSFLSLATSMGVFFTIFLSSATFWESINLKPLGFGFLVTYFFQSFSMLFYDTKICSTNKCQMGPGTFMSILASLCWITACVAAAKMDYFKTQARRQRRREARRTYKETKKASKSKRERSRKAMAYTERTASTGSSDASSVSDVAIIGLDDTRVIRL
jgi:hypothetical protein